MPAPLLLDLTHTCHTRARTGIQRVTRSLYHSLGERAWPITHDPYARTWRMLAGWEHAALRNGNPGTKRSARWPLRARLSGNLSRAFRSVEPVSAKVPAASAAGLVVPELFSAAVGKAFPALLAQVQGPRVALFHDAIALKFPELTPSQTVARFPAYLLELLKFDSIAAVSADSRDSLVDYWNWLEVRDAPRVVAIPLGITPQPFRPKGEGPPDLPLEVLCVGSIEGRKNHLTLLQACETLWASGLSFRLRLIGLPQPQTAAAALSRIQELKTAGRPLRFDGPVADAELHAAYASCAFTVYPSLVEGFGLPVLESIAHGRPCICSAQGALGESARGGGCLALSKVNAESIGAAMRRFLTSKDELATLRAAAAERQVRTWEEYTADLLAWLGEKFRR